jgi:hypothetical protein
LSHLLSVGILTLAAASAMTPRTLVLTEEQLLLCDEDWGHWPPNLIASTTLPTTPQFSKVLLMSVADIVGVVSPAHILLAFCLFFSPPSLAY